MSRKLRAGIVGAGFMAGVHARAIRDAGHEVIGVAASSFDSTCRAASKLDIPTAFSSWEDLVSSPEVDVVHICTPNELHAPIIKASFAEGKQVVCEKPISVSFEEALEVLDASKSASSGFAVPLVYRFYPIAREMRSRIMAGEAGDIHLMHGSYLQDWLADSMSNNWRVDSLAGGASRAFADIGMHWCDLMEFVSSDRIVRLIANTSKAYETRSGSKALTEDIANVIFETERGATGSLTVSQVSHGRKNRLWLEMSGSKASYSFDQENPDSMWIGGTSSNQIVMRGQESLVSADSKRLTRVPSGHPQGYQDAFNAFMSDAYSSFLGNQPEGLPSLIDGVRSAALVQAVLESAASKQWVEVPSVDDLAQAKLLARK